MKLSDEQIGKIFEELGGYEGFCKKFGYLQFARAVLDAVPDKKECQGYEKWVAIMEGNRNRSTDIYFDLRPELDSISNRRIFESGFVRGYTIADGQDGDN